MKTLSVVFQSLLAYLSCIEVSVLLSSRIFAVKYYYRLHSFPEEFDGSVPFVFSATHLTGNPTANDDGVQMDLAGVNGGTPKVYDTGTRYIKFYFESDVAPSYDGWNFIVSSGAGIGVGYPINSLLYLSSNSSGPSAPYSTVTSSNPSTGTSTIPIGYTLSIIETNPAEPYIFARIHDR